MKVGKIRNSLKLIIGNRDINLIYTIIYFNTNTNMESTLDSSVDAHYKRGLLVPANTKSKITTISKMELTLSI